MFKNSFLSCFIILLLISCATTPPPAANLSEKSTIGIINLIDSEATHTHFGTTVFTNFEKKYPVTWKFPEKMEQSLSDEIERSTGLKVIKIEPTKKISDNENKILDMTWSVKLNPGLISEVEDIMQQNKVDLLLIIRDFHGEDYFGGTGKYLHNYGLYTRSFLGIKMAHAYAYSNVAGFYGNPPQYIGGAIFDEHPEITEFEFPPNLKEMDVDRLNSLAHFITDKIHDFTLKVLDQTGLKPINLEEKPGASKDE